MTADDTDRLVLDVVVRENTRSETLSDFETLFREQFSACYDEVECNVSENAAHNGYTVRCKECGATEHGDPEDDLEWDKRYHRMHHCPDADFEVAYR